MSGFIGTGLAKETGHKDACLCKHSTATSVNCSDFLAGLCWDVRSGGSKADTPHFLTLTWHILELSREGHILFYLWMSIFRTKATVPADTWHRARASVHAHLRVSWIHTPIWHQRGLCEEYKPAEEKESVQGRRWDPLTLPSAKEEDACQRNPSVALILIKEEVGEQSNSDKHMKNFERLF